MNDLMRLRPHGREGFDPGPRDSVQCRCVGTIARQYRHAVLQGGEERSGRIAVEPIWQFMLGHGTLEASTKSLLSARRSRSSLHATLLP